MINPTIGRVVLYRPTDAEDEETRNAAIITEVHLDTIVNLAVFDDTGVPFNRQYVNLMQEDRVAKPGECEWMDYQKDTKTEQVGTEIAVVLDGFMEQTADRVNSLNERILDLEKSINHPIQIAQTELEESDYNAEKQE